MIYARDPSNQYIHLAIVSIAKQYKEENTNEMASILDVNVTAYLCVYVNVNVKSQNNYKTGKLHR